MRRMTPPPRRDGGFALLAAVIFVLVVTLVGMGFFSVTWSESRGSIYRQRSSEAFYLADAAVERLRARFLADSGWRGGWSAVACGGGTYDLSVADTVIAGAGPAVRIEAVGRVDGVARSVRMTSELVPTALEMALAVSGDARFAGEPRIAGPVHVSGDGSSDRGSDPLLAGNGGYTEGFRVGPPSIDPMPDRFAGVTYYAVAGTVTGGQVQARIFDAELNDITTAAGDSLTGGVAAYSAVERRYTFAFRGADVARYFDDAAGVFRRRAGAASVVVDFGASPPNPADVTSTIVLESGGPIHCTILNSRFIGLSESDRLRSEFWTGGEVRISAVAWEPYGGIALLAHDLVHAGGTAVELGTGDWPALIYATRDVTGVGAGFRSVGTIVCLRDWESAGSLEITRSGGYVVRLPGSLLGASGAGVSGTMRIVQWRETAAAGGGPA